MPSRHYGIPNALLAPRLTSPSTPSQLEYPFLPKPPSFEMKCFIFNGIDWGDIGSKACRFQMYHSTPSSGTASYAGAPGQVSSLFFLPVCPPTPYPLFKIRLHSKPRREGWLKDCQLMWVRKNLSEDSVSEAGSRLSLLMGT